MVKTVGVSSVVIGTHILNTVRDVFVGKKPIYTANVQGAVTLGWRSAWMNRGQWIE